MNGINKLRIGLVASAGGHMSQLLKLSSVWAGCETIYVTTGEMIRIELAKHGKVFMVGECNRMHPLHVIRVFVRCVRIMVKERPDVMISTGAAVGCIACYLGKMLGARVIWIDSITNVERISLSGRLIRPIANLFLVQWPNLTEKYGNVEFAGTLI